MQIILKHSYFFLLSLLFFLVSPALHNNVFADVSISEYSISTSDCSSNIPCELNSITSGPDGNIWFTNFLNGYGIGKFATSSGTTTFFPELGANDITNGPDGKLWFTTSTVFIGNITTDGTDSNIQLPPNESGGGITKGPDNNLWFTDGGANSIVKMTTGGSMTEYPIPTANASPGAITLGSDGNLWFTEGNTTNSLGIGKITPDGTITEFSLPDQINHIPNITSGPDGNIWFTIEEGKIGRITPDGTVTEFTVPTANASPWGIVRGPDNNLWFTELNGQKIGKITTNGIITELPIPDSNAYPLGITVGPDSNLWFTEMIGFDGNAAIGKVTLNQITSFPFEVLTDGYNFVNEGVTPNANWWSTYEQAFGTDQVDTPSGAHDPMAQIIYDDKFLPLIEGGSCFGISATSLLINKDNGLLSMFDQSGVLVTHDLTGPQVAIINGLKYYNSDSVSQYIARYQGVQISSEYDSSASAQSLNIKDVYNTVKQDIQQGFIDPSVIGLRDLATENGHAVVPYKVVDYSDNTSKIFVYDPNDPCAPGTPCQPISSFFTNPYNRYISINWNDNPVTWEYAFDQFSIDEYFHLGAWTNPQVFTIPLSFIKQNHALPPLSLHSDFYVTSTGIADLYISNNQNNAIGYQSGSFINTLQGARINIPMLGNVTGVRPSYTVPSDTYSIHIQGKQTENDNFDIFGSNTLIRIINMPESSSAADTVVTSNSNRNMSITTNGSRKSFDASLYLKPDSSTTKEFNLIGLNIAQGETESLNMKSDNNSIEIINNAQTQNINLTIKQVGLNNGILQYAQPITITSGDRVIITPSDWNNLSSSSAVIVQTDVGNSGGTLVTSYLNITSAALSPTASSDGTFSDPVTVTLAMNPPSGVTISHTYYKVDSGSQQTYTSPFTVAGTGSHTVTYWSVDSSGNLEQQNIKTFTIAASTLTTHSFWSNSVTPAMIEVNDPTADSGGVELGMKFQSDISGQIKGIRFYKSSGNTGTHIGHLWNNSGTELANVTFSNETGSGWQEADFLSPVGIDANTTYVVSYFAPNGHYSADNWYFIQDYANEPLHGMADTSSSHNGVYHWGADVFPTSNYKASNYWVDPVFTTTNTIPTPTPTPTPPSGSVTLFSSSSTPATANVNDPNAIQLGMKFTTESAGKVYGVRFYKGSQNIGTHIGYLYSNSGTLLSQVRFDHETSSGWQQALFATPIDVSANTTYVVSFFAPIGFYSADGNYFANQIDNAPLHGLSSSASGGNGVYNYGSEQTLPTNSFNSTNYWVDVVFRGN